MPWIALFDGEKKGAYQVPKRTDVECPECGGRMRVWGKSSDGKARHFKHVDNMGHGEGGGGSGPDCESVGESDKHLKWKNFAAEQLEKEFHGNVAECRVEKELEAPISDKNRRIGDAVLVFEEPDEQLGEGIVVEVQHRNESKDIETTTADYIRQGFAVAWTYQDDYATDRCKLVEVDFRDRARKAAWPEHVIPAYEWSGYTIDTARMFPWRSEWETSRAALSNEGLSYPIQSDRVRRARKQILDEWKIANIEWSEPTIPVTLPPEFYDEAALEIWRNQPWDWLFDHPEPYQIDEPSVSIRVSLTQEVLDSLDFRSTDWTDLFSDSQSDTYISNVIDHFDLPKAVIPVTLPEYVVRRIKASCKSEIKRPPNPFDDIQCNACGTYWGIDKRYEQCPKCKVDVDFDWNLRTGRISKFPEWI